MAENKKSFLLYCDYIGVFEQLSDREAGLLIKHILRYVNDKNPTVDSRIVNMAFEPIKAQLKRDLRIWEAERSKRSEAGKKGGIKSGESRRAGSKRSSASKNEANEADNVTVNGTVTVNATAVEEVGSDRVKEVANEVWKDQNWKDSMCIGLNTTPSELKMWLAQFNASLAGDSMPDFDKGKYKKLSRGWIVKQQERGIKVQSGPAKKSDSAPLSIVNHGN